MSSKNSTPKYSVHPKILEYVEKLMKQSVLKELPAEQFSLYRQRFALRAQAMVALEMMRQITSEKQAAVNDFMDKNLTQRQIAVSQLSDFLRVVLPDFKQITDFALRKFKQDFLTNFKK